MPGQDECDHAGSVWRVHILSLGTLHEPGNWECTRCGQQWDDHPALQRIRQHA